MFVTALSFHHSVCASIAIASSSPNKLFHIPFPVVEEEEIVTSPRRNHSALFQFRSGYCTSINSFFLERVSRAKDPLSPSCRYPSHPIPPLLLSLPSHPLF